MKAVNGGGYKFDGDICRISFSQTCKRSSMTYCALVWSSLEYESVTWLPFTARNITKLKRVQRRAMKIILETEDGYEVRGVPPFFYVLLIFFIYIKL